MSDGDSATHGPDADDIGLTGAPPGSRGAAPWERFGTTQTATIAHRWVGPSAMSEPREPEVPARPVERAGNGHGDGGSHAEGGLSVADLIAKIGGPVAERPRHHHAAPDDLETLRPAPSPPAEEPAGLRRLRVAEPGGLRRRTARS